MTNDPGPEICNLLTPRILGYIRIIRKPVATVHFSLLFNKNAEILGLPQHDVTGAVGLMSRCLRVDPADRPSAIQLLRESQWLLELGDDF
jgi:hypothetical protein